MLLSKRTSRSFDRLYARLPFLAICLILLKLAFDLARNGMPKLAALFVMFLLPLELIYRWVHRLIDRNPRKWWADPARGTWWFNTFPAWVALLCMPLVVLIQSPFARYFLLALLLASIICAGIIRFLNRDGQV